MEALKTAIGAMKLAEESLAKQGFILRWKVRVKADCGFFRKAVSRLIADTPVQQKTPGIRAAPEKPAREKKARKEQKPKTEKTALEPCPETDEARPVTAFGVAEAAEYLGITHAGVYDLGKRGRLPFHGRRGERWFKVEELDQYLGSKKTQDS